MNPNPTPIRIVLVDDHKLFRDGIASLLEREADFVVAGQAQDGNAAVELVRQLEPDVVLMDIQMPNCTGLEATRQLIGWRPGVKIIILTVSDSDADVFEAVKAGAQGYLLKSNTGARELVDAVHRVAANEAIITPSLVPFLFSQFAALAQRENEPAATAHPPAHESGETVPEQPHDTLTEREHEVLQLVAEGLKNREIAARLFVSENTVRSHLRNILDKLHVRNRVQAAALFQHQKS